LSQAVVAAACGISRSTYSRVESGKAPTVTIVEASRIGAALGLDIVVRAYPGGEPLRDVAQERLLALFLADVRQPLRWAVEVPLPASNDHLEQRAWDAVLRGGGRRTAIEVEMRIRDGQALERRLALKRRDDPADAFLLVVADTRTNRRVLAEHPGLFGDLARLRRRTVLAAVRAGCHPPTGLILLGRRSTRSG
jgi:transcriptional regulator with XRE-family HTH domain